MKEPQCLYCYQVLDGNSIDFHPACSRRFFKKNNPPLLEITGKQLTELANKAVSRSIAVTGVQPKISLDIENIPGDEKQSRLTIVGLWGNYILKPANKTYPHLPENEDLTMHLAALLGIPTAEHSLIKLKSGELAYITKRFDREKKEKLACEDMCQLNETLTADKYRGSMEKVGKHIAKFSARTGIDLINFFETALFCYITGNADMHLKNFSLLTTNENETMLSPAYDLLCTRIAMPDDKDETALTINGRNRRLVKKDFDAFAANLGLSAKTIENSYKKFSSKMPVLSKWIDISFLPANLKKGYKKITTERAKKLFL